jgi:hypothetical protein
MKVVFALAVSALLLGCAVSADASDKSIRTLEITSIAPASFEELWNEADVVARVRVLGGHPELKKSAANPAARYVFTSHRIEVLEIYKAQVSIDCARLADEVTQCSPRSGDESLLLQSAGEVETADELIRVAGESPLKPGAAYILFLRWDAYWKAFMPTHGPHATFEIRNGAIHPASKWRVSKEHEGKTAEKFAEELRRKGAQR